MYFTKYILNDFTFDYKSRLNLLPLMHYDDLLDILFLVLKYPPVSFNIFDYVSFSSGIRSHHKN